MTSHLRRRRTLPAIRRTATALVATAFCLASGGVADARSWSHNDAAHDVRKEDATKQGDSFVADPSASAGDIRNVRISHGKHRVTVKITTRTFLPSERWWQARATIRTPQGTYWATVTKFDDPQPVMDFDKRNGDGDVGCKHMTYSTDRARRTVQLNVPRKCVGAPRWVQVGASTVTSTARDAWFHTDDGLRRGLNHNPQTYASSSWTFALSPRLRRN